MTYELVNYNIDKSMVKTKVEIIKKEIEESRQELYNLINKTEDFGDPNIIIQSQKLDQLLNEYEQIKFDENIQKI